MGTLSWVWIVTSSACLISFVHTVPLELPIDCTLGTSVQLGDVDEGYSGDLERIPNVPDVELVLETICPQCAEFLEFIFITSITNATVRTKKPLDAEALRETRGLINYQITCITTGVTNSRTLFVRDVNEHEPVFDKEEYRAEVSKTLNVGEVVIQVRATDADLTPHNNLFTYSIQEPTNTFEVNNYGEILLKEYLTSTDIIQYNLKVKAQDGGGLFSETRVIINITDTVNLMFEYDVYNASIPENQLGPVREVLPAPIKANGTGNHSVIYSIREVFPSDYWSNFTIDQSTGVIQVVTELNFEEMKDPVIIHIKASLETDSTRTANATVTVHVKNVNEAPLFNDKLYTAEIFSTAPTNQHVVKVEATDPDVGDTLQYSLVTPSSMFAVEPSSGQVYVVSVAGESGKVSLQVKAEDQQGLNDTTAVETPTTTLEVYNYGEILLKEYLTSTDIFQYNLTVKAQDGGGLFSETRVIINIIDTVSLMFEYDVYEASIPENQLGPVPEVLPAPIKANGTGNHTVIYSIREVFPSDYWSNFTIDHSTGVIQVVTELDFEEIKDPVIIHIKVSLETDRTRTANATVTVHVENMNEAPVFNVKLYTAEIFSTAPTNQHVVKIEATDPDVGETLQYSLVTPSSMFAVEPSSGQVYVVSVAGQSGKVSLQVKAEDQRGLYDTTTVEVTVHAKNVNEPPVFNIKLYTAEIFSATPTNQHVVKIEATDPDVGDTLQYSLVKPSSMFAVEPSSGLVYVVSVAGVSGKVNLQVKAEDQSGLYDTTTVEVTIKESDSTDVVVISVNQELSTVQNKTAEMEEALERALGWSVTIISVSISGQGSALSRTPDIHSVQRQNTPRTFVSFLATEINGTNVIAKDSVQKKLQDDKENVLVEMEQVFGKDFQFDVVYDPAKNNIPLIPIILGTVIPLVLIVVGLSIYKAIRNRPSNSKKHTTSSVPMQNKGDSSNKDSMRGKSDVKEDTDPMRGRPDLKEDRDSMRGRPDLKEDRDSMRGRPDLKEDRDSMRGRPDLKEDRDSMRGRPDLKEDRDSMRGRPDLKEDRDSMRGRPDLKEDRDSMRGRPDLKEDRDSMRGRPDLKEDRDSMRGRPDLKEDRDSMRGRPDLKEDRDSMRGKPDLKDRDSMRGRPDLKEDRDSMRGRPDLKDRDSMRGRPDLQEVTDCNE